MRFLTRLLKTPDEDQEEDQDEFGAEENGLLMVQALSGGKGTAFAVTPEPDDTHTVAPTAEPANQPSGGEVTPVEAAAEQFTAVAGEPPAPTDESPPPESETAETATEEAKTQQDSPDDPMHMFRASAKRTHMSPALREGVQDVSTAELLATAHSVRETLLGGQAAPKASERDERAA